MFVCDKIYFFGLGLVVKQCCDEKVGFEGYEYSKYVDFLVLVDFFYDVFNNESGYLWCDEEWEKRNGNIKFFLLCCSNV